jgi:SH3 domain-containing YSC84-like protein 1
MKKVIYILLMVNFAWLLDPGSSLRADCPETAILEKANVVLCQLATTPLTGHLLTNLLRKAQGVAIFPGVIKAGALVGARHGRGVLLTREADGSWGPPVFLTLSGVSVGNQLGIEGTDLVLLLRTRRSLDRIRKGKLTLDAGVSLAVCSLGREKLLGTDVCLETGILSSSHSKGLFAGVFVEGAVWRIDAGATAAYGQYEQSCSQDGSPSGSGVSPSLRLQMTLAELSAPAADSPR